MVEIWLPSPLFEWLRVSLRTWSLLHLLLTSVGAWSDTEVFFQALRRPDSVQRQDATDVAQWAPAPPSWPPLRVPGQPQARGPNPGTVLPPSTRVGDAMEDTHVHPAAPGLGGTTAPAALPGHLYCWRERVLHHAAACRGYPSLPSRSSKGESRPSSRPGSRLAPRRAVACPRRHANREREFLRHAKRLRESKSTQGQRQSGGAPWLRVQCLLTSFVNEIPVRNSRRCHSLLEFCDGGGSAGDDPRSKSFFP